MDPGNSVNAKYTISSEGQVNMPAGPTQSPRTIFTDKSAAEGQTYAELSRFLMTSTLIKQLILFGWMSIIGSLFVLLPAGLVTYKYFKKRLLHVARLWKPNKDKAGLVRVKAIYQGDTSTFFRTAYEIAVRDKNLFAVRSVRFEDCKCLVLLIKGGFESLALSQVNVTLKKADDGKHEVSITGRKRFLAPWEDKDKLDTLTTLVMQELVEELSFELPGFTLIDAPKTIFTAREEVDLRLAKSKNRALGGLGISFAPREQVQFHRKALVWVLLGAELIYLLVGGCELMFIWILARLIFKT
jgi:hypothetical protein